MFVTYWILFAAILVVSFFLCSAFGNVMYILGILFLAAVLAALATIATRIRDLEGKIDKLLEKKKDEHEE